LASALAAEGEGTGKSQLKTDWYSLTGSYIADVQEVADPLSALDYVLKGPGVPEEREGEFNQQLKGRRLVWSFGG
jgi:hypothetical protein